MTRFDPPPPHEHQKGVISEKDFDARLLHGTSNHSELKVIDASITLFTKKINLTNTVTDEIEGLEGYFLTRRMLEGMLEKLLPVDDPHACILISVGVGPKQTEYTHSGRESKESQETIHFIFKGARWDKETKTIKMTDKIVFSTFPAQGAHITTPPSKPPYGT